MDCSDEQERRPEELARGPGMSAGDKPSGGDPYGYWDGEVYRHDYRGAVIWCPKKKFRGVSTGSRKSCSCGADRIFLRWDDGDRSWPCIKALEQIGPNEFKYRG